MADQCNGYNQVEMVLDAYTDAEAFAKYPLKVRSVFPLRLKTACARLNMWTDRNSLCMNALAKAHHNRNSMKLLLAVTAFIRILHNKDRGKHYFFIRLLLKMVPEPLRPVHLRLLHLRPLHLCGQCTFAATYFCGQLLFRTFTFAVRYFLACTLPAKTC